MKHYLIAISAVFSLAGVSIAGVWHLDTHIRGLHEQVAACQFVAIESMRAASSKKLKVMLPDDLDAAVGVCSGSVD